MRDTGKNKAEEADEVKEDAPFEEGIHRHGIVLRRLPSCRSHRRRSAWRSFVKKKEGEENAGMNRPYFVKCSDPSKCI